VRFVGRQPLEGLDAWYRHALAVTVPSLCYEVFGMVIIEAFATGTPVIARDRGALAEIVRESDGGLLFATDQELHDAVTRIETDPALRLSLAVNGARTLEQQWTVERHLEHYFAIIARAVARRRSRGASA
jgi:glycosyltransferase involved in cell wall biosynthesis